MKKSTRFCYHILVLLIFICFFGCDILKTERTLKFQGEVKDSYDNSPISNATVTFGKMGWETGKPILSVYTNTQGQYQISYSFEEDFFSLIYLTAEHQGYSSVTYNSLQKDLPLSTSTENIQRINFFLNKSN